MRSMNIPVRCSTLAGLAKVCHLFSEEENVPYFENISAALSRKLGRKIVVKGSLNTAQVTEALRNVGKEPYKYHNIPCFSTLSKQNKRLAFEWCKR